jgi:hypothetical protein
MESPCDRLLGDVGFCKAPSTNPSNFQIHAQLSLWRGSGVEPGSQAAGTGSCSLRIWLADWVLLTDWCGGLTESYCVMNWLSLTDWLSDWLSLTDWLVWWTESYCVMNWLSLTDWLIDWLSLTDWLIEWLSLTDLLIDWLSLTDWLIDWLSLTDWLMDWVLLTDWWTDWVLLTLMDWVLLTDWWTDWVLLTDWWTDWVLLTDWWTDWFLLADWLTDWVLLTDWLPDWLYQWAPKVQHTWRSTVPFLPLLNQLKQFLSATTHILSTNFGCPLLEVVTFLRQFHTSRFSCIPALQMILYSICSLYQYIQQIEYKRIQRHVEECSVALLCN